MMGPLVLASLMCPVQVAEPHALPPPAGESDLENPGPTFDDLRPPAPPPQRRARTAAPPRSSPAVPPSTVRAVALGAEVTSVSGCALTGVGLGVAGAMVALGLSPAMTWGGPCLMLPVMAAGIPLGVAAGTVSYLAVRGLLPFLVVHPPGHDPGLKGRLVMAGTFLVVDVLAHMGAIAVALLAMAISVGVTLVVTTGVMTVAARAPTPDFTGLYVAFFIALPVALGVGGAVLLGMLGLVQPLAPLAASVLREVEAARVADARPGRRRVVTRPQRPTD